MKLHPALSVLFIFLVLPSAKATGEGIDVIVRRSRNEVKKDVVSLTEVQMLGRSALSLIS